MKKLMKGNDAIIHGALIGGCTHFFGYPITPASEIAHSAAYYFTKAGRTFLQAESEIAAINMILGSASAGTRVMTSSSSPGVALMSEAISYIAGSNLPAVIVDIQRVGPGLGYIWPEQSDYNMVVKGGGHGVYRNIVLAPNSVQEMADSAYKAFELADKYRMCVIILADAYIGQMMEPVSFPTKVLKTRRKDYAVYADGDSRQNCITSLFMERSVLSANIDALLEKYKKVENEAVEYEEFYVDDAEHIFIGFGICSRIALTAVRDLRKQGVKVGLFRPKTLFPFPNKRLNELSSRVKSMMVVELNDGMMANDVELAVKSRIPVRRLNWYGGYLPTVNELIEKTRQEI